MYLEGDQRVESVDIWMIGGLVLGSRGSERGAMKGWHGWMRRDRAGTVLKNRTVLRPFPSVGQICDRVNTELSIVHICVQSSKI